MKVKKLDGHYILRLEIGEEIVESIKKLCADENVKLATVSGIGATDKASIGLYKPQSKEYISKELEGDFEIVSLNGNITQMEGEPYLHLHIAIGDEQYQLYGGHLNYAYISATAEIFIQEIKGEMGRFHEEGIGLNLLDI